MPQNLARNRQPGDVRPFEALPATQRLSIASLALMLANHFWAFSGRPAISADDWRFGVNPHGPQSLTGLLVQYHGARPAGLVTPCGVIGLPETSPAHAHAFARQATLSVADVGADTATSNFVFGVVSPPFRGYHLPVPELRFTSQRLGAEHAKQLWDETRQALGSAMRAGKFQGRRTIARPRH